jgi:hypothetical protein
MLRPQPRPSSNMHNNNRPLRNSSRLPITIPTNPRHNLNHIINLLISNNNSNSSNSSSNSNSNSSHNISNTFPNKSSKIKERIIPTHNTAFLPTSTQHNQLKPPLNNNNNNLSRARLTLAISVREMSRRPPHTSILLLPPLRRLKIILMDLSVN